MTESPVLFEERAAANGLRVAFATLNAPKSLNALTQTMIDALHPQLDRWACDPAIACVVLAGSGEKAFCAGGDVVGIYRSIQERPGGPNPAAERFFESEYRLDYLIHTFPKPVLCWGHGIVMGGGLGLMAGASHRVVTERSRIAMPEITIGLYPDVAGSWFLNRMPGRVGLFLGLTAARLNAADALYVGLADYFLDSSRRQEVMERLPQLDWAEDPELNRGQLSLLLREFADQDAGERPDSAVLRHLDLINHVCDRHSVEHIRTALERQGDAGDPWIAEAQQALAAGSPTSARVIFEQYRRGCHLSLREAFQMEMLMSINMIRRPDFAEGVRALLVDKDRAPQWKPPGLEQVDDALVEAQFRLPAGIPSNPLADLT